MKTYSQKWIEAKRAAGLCLSCGQAPVENGKTRCGPCLARAHPCDKRRPGPAFWRSVNWDLPVQDIAKLAGVSHQAVYKQKKEAARFGEP